MSVNGAHVACVSPYLALCAFLVAASYIARALDLPHSAAPWGLFDLRMFVWRVSWRNWRAQTVGNQTARLPRRDRTEAAVGNFNNDLWLVTRTFDVLRISKPITIILSLLAKNWVLVVSGSPEWHLEQLVIPKNIPSPTLLAELCWNISRRPSPVPAPSRSGHLFSEHKNSKIKTTNLFRTNSAKRILYYPK